MNVTNFCDTILLKNFIQKYLTYVNIYDNICIDYLIMIKFLYSLNCGGIFPFTFWFML